MRTARTVRKADRLSGPPPRKPPAASKPERRTSAAPSPPTPGPSHERLAEVDLRRCRVAWAAAERGERTRDRADGGADDEQPPAPAESPPVAFEVEPQFLSTGRPCGRARAARRACRRRASSATDP